jgi:hypothetical protein
MDEHEKYEADCKKIRKANESLLADFEAWLKSSGLSDKTIGNHLSNIDFYINEYLLYEDAIEAKDGVHSISMFLGYWFIKKAMWASQTSIKNNATSLKKFYVRVHDPLNVQGWLRTSSPAPDWPGWASTPAETKTAPPCYKVRPFVSRQGDYCGLC